MKKFVWQLVVFLVGVFTCSLVNAAILLETAPLGIANGGTAIYTDQFLGAKFYLDDDYVITGVGGHVKASSGGNSLFVAIVPLYDVSLLPLDTSLSDAIFYAVFEAPYNDVGPYPYQVPETIIETDFVLEPGNYGIIFGSGLFGATGTGRMPVGPGGISVMCLNKNIGDYWRNINDQSTRFVVEGFLFEEQGIMLMSQTVHPTPEPASMFLLGVGLVGLAGVGKKRLTR